MILTTREFGNLALHVGDDEVRVRANRARLAEKLGVPWVQFMHQVHGDQVAVVDRVSEDDIDGVDALVTSTPGVAIAVLVADCVPVVIAGKSAVAVVHAGRRGVAAGVVDVAVSAVRQRDADPLHAVVGPAICGQCYEVPAQMQTEICESAPEARTTTSRGTPGLDLPAAVRAQLARAGVTVDPGVGPCTFEDHAYYSHRREKATGRFAAVAVLVS